MPSFKDTLAVLRKRNKLTQNELGAMLGLSGSTISMYERGEREPSKEALELIADHFNVPLDYLVGRSETERENAGVSLDLDDEEQMLIYCWRQATPEIKENIAFALRSYGMPRPQGKKETEYSTSHGA